MLGPPGPIDEPLRAAMKAAFTPAEIVELSAGIALFVGFSKIAIVLGQAPESMPTTVMPTPTLPEPNPPS